MESINEKVAGVMGWRTAGGGIYRNGGWINLNFIEDAKLLQQHMVEGDGWIVQVTQYGKDHFNAAAFKGHGMPHEYQLLNVATEPAAIVELFCKCYGISK